jgi:hypothetical protein
MPEFRPWTAPGRGEIWIDGSTLFDLTYTSNNDLRKFFEGTDISQKGTIIG